MESTLVGYFPKRTAKEPTWLANPNVREICSVSSCISPGPNDWIDRWQHNQCWMFDTPELALSVVPESGRNEFDLYAYRVFAIEFKKGVPSPILLPNLNVLPLDESFQNLGYDIACSYGGYTTGCNFDCSPLSCNHMAETVQVNEHCLIDSFDVATQLAARFEADGCEPGPYYIVQVFRRNKWESSTQKSHPS